MARRLSNTHPNAETGPDGIVMEGPYLPMQINLPETIGPVFLIGPFSGRRCLSYSPLPAPVIPFAGRRAWFRLFSAVTLAHIIVPVIHRFLTYFPAATEVGPMRPTPPRRRREAPSPPGCGDGKRIPRALEPSPPEQSPPLPYRLPSGGQNHLKLLHHQARDTLQEGEGA